jgi:hypothetical protein
MNDELIFVKTSAGEEAVRDRTRLVQRNLRMVLILVDGLTKVAALKQKAGDPAMIETALAELDRIGLIESLNKRGSRQASAIAEAISSSPPAAIEPEEPLLDDYPTADTVFEALGPVTAPVQDTLAPQMPRPQPIGPGTPASAKHASSDGWFSRTRKRWHQMREERAYEKAYGTPSQEDAEPPPDRRTAFPRRRMKLKSVLGATALMLVAFAIARVVLYPYDEHRPAIEAQISTMLDDEVKIGKIALVFSPWPAFKGTGLVVGKDADVIVEQVMMKLDPGYLLGEQPFRSASISGLEFRERAIGKMNRWFLPANMGSFYLDQISVENLTLDLGWTQIRGLSGALVPGMADGPTFSGRTGPTDLHFEIVPIKTGLRVSVKAGQWIAPLEPPLTVSALDLNGVLSSGQFSITNFDARMFDGLVSGTGLVSWESTRKVVLDLSAKHVSAPRLLEALRAPVLLEGELAGQAQYSNTSPSRKWLAQSARLTGSMTAVRGHLKRIDLAGALKNASQRSSPPRGGDTGFEDLSGKFALEAGKVQISDIRMSSGLMLASGQATFPAENDRISGVANVEMRGSARAPRATIAIGGSARDPELRVGR